MPASIHAYARDLESLMLFLQARDINDIKDTPPDALIAHVRSMTAINGYASATISRHLATIKIFFRWLLVRGLVSSLGNLFWLRFGKIDNA